MDFSTLAWPELSGILVAIVAVTVGGIQWLKATLCQHVRAKWTQRIPPWVWVVLSAAIPMGLIALLNADLIQSAINAALPEEPQVNLGNWGTVGTGIIAAFGPKGAYSGLKKVGVFSKDYSPGGPNDITPPVDTSAQIPQETYGKPEQTSTITPEAQDNPPMVTVPAGPLLAPEPVTAPAFPETATFAEQANVPKQETPTYAHLLAYCSTEPDLVIIDGDPPIVVPVQSEEMRAWATSPPPQKMHSW